MKKTLIAASIAALVAAPSAMATTIFGDLKYDIQNTDSDSGDSLVIGGRARLGFTGAEDVSGGLKAVYKVDMEFKGNGAHLLSNNEGIGTFSGSDNISMPIQFSGSTCILTTTGPGTNVSCPAQTETGTANVNISGPVSTSNMFKFRDIYVGLAGSFGTVIMGRAEAPNKSNDSVVDKFKAHSFGDVSLTTGRVNNAMAYISPSFEGLNFALTVVADGVNTITTAGANNTDAQDYHVGYTNGPLTVKAGIHDVTGLYDVKSIGIGYNAGDIYVGAYYDERNWDGGNDYAQYFLRGAYRTGNNSIALGYRSIENISDPALNTIDNDKAWQLELDHYFSKRTTGYVAYMDWNDATENNNFNKLTAGLQVKF